jgi:3-hydroxybutyryl-CoA dehydratase
MSSRPASNPPGASAGKLSIGIGLPVLKRHVTQDVIDNYAKASGDFNPIHVDPDFAAKGPFGRTIAHGLMTLAFVSQLMNDWSGGAFDECGALDVAFVGPVFAGDTVEVSGIVESMTEVDGRPAALVKIICKAGDRQILAGTATQPLEPVKEI